MDLSTRLAVARRKRNLKQKDVAALVGISAKHLSQVEQGRSDVRHMRGEHLAALARQLGVSVDYLLGLTDHEGACVA